MLTTSDTATAAVEPDDPEAQPASDAADAAPDVTPFNPPASIRATEFNQIRDKETC